MAKNPRGQEKADQNRTEDTSEFRRWYACCWKKAMETLLHFDNRNSVWPAVSTIMVKASSHTLTPPIASGSCGLAPFLN